MSTTDTRDIDSILDILWHEMRRIDNFHIIIQEFMVNELSRGTQLRDYFQQAFSPFYRDEPRNPSKQYDALTKWASHLHYYAYKSIHPQEHDFYQSLFAIVSTNFPNVANRWMTPKQLTEEYGFSESWQNKARMVSSGSTLPFHKVGKFVKYDRHEIDQWIEQHKVR